MRSFFAGAALVAVPVALNGCGSGGGGGVPGSNTTTTATTTTTTTTPVSEACADNQGQCDSCLQGECLTCNPGYQLDNSTVPGGTCVTTCDPNATVSNPSRPSDPEGFSGQAWPEMCMASKTSAHFFGIGDWGGEHPDQGDTWDNPGVAERFRGHYTQGADYFGMMYVARQMKDLATRTDPDFVLNAGDNFYPGGYGGLSPEHCGPEQLNNDDPDSVFKKTFEGIYSGPGMDGKPWLGVLGNHDYGGRSMTAAWDQLIFHSWYSDIWRTPAPFWSQRVQYQDFAVQLIFLDSNYNDAFAADQNHLICQETYDSGYCWGVTSDTTCQAYFQRQWKGGIEMAKNVLKDSTAEWHILVTHYPAVFGAAEITDLHDTYGLDVVFTGHDHLQILAQEENGMVTITSGGGGGVTSDSGAINTATGDDDALGFVDFEISRTELKVSMHTWGGCTTCDGTDTVPAPQVIRKTVTVAPHGSAPAPPAPSGPTPAPGPSAGTTCCWGASAGGCEDYPAGVNGGLCNGDWTTPCTANSDCSNIQFV